MSFENKNIYTKILVKDEVESTSKPNGHIHLSNSVGSKKEDFNNLSTENEEGTQEKNENEKRECVSDIKENTIPGYKFTGVS